MKLNLLAPDVTRDPYPFYAELRRLGPAVQIEPGGMWAIGRYDDAVAALRDVAAFSSAGLSRAYEPEWLGYNPVAHSMVGQDPPRHTALRGLVNAAFSAQATARIEGAVRDTAEQLAAEVVRGGEVDFVEEFAAKLPVATLGRLLGLDIAALPGIRRWLAAMGAITAARTPEQQREIRETMQDMERQMTDLIAASRRASADDFLGDLVRAEIDGAALSDAELVSFLFLLLGAGTSTTVHLISNMALALGAHPRELERARAEPAHIPRIIEEVLRYEAPVRALFRTARAGAQVSGVAIPEGSRVVVLVGSANRDERHFAEPDRFLPERERQSHIGFGHGVHFCLGPGLARMEARFALEALLPRIHGLEVSMAGVAWEVGVSMRGPRVLPVRFTLAGGH